LTLVFIGTRVFTLLTQFKGSRPPYSPTLTEFKPEPIDPSAPNPGGSRDPKQAPYPSTTPRALERHRATDAAVNNDCRAADCPGTPSAVRSQSAVCGPTRPYTSQTNGVKVWGGLEAGSAGAYLETLYASRVSAATARSGATATRDTRAVGKSDVTDTSPHATPPVDVRVARRSGRSAARAPSRPTSTTTEPYTPDRRSAAATSCTRWLCSRMWRPR